MISFLVVAYTVFALGRIFILWQSRQLKHLKNSPLVTLSSLPKLSVVIAARNEEQNIKAALESVLTNRYADYEVIVVNDRSTDNTAKILEELGAQHQKLRILKIEMLPVGWLGKNHALHQGAQIASGEWVLFTDADVVFEPEAFGLALKHVTHYKIDHLALLMRTWSRSFIVDCFIPYFGIQFLLFFRPWEASDPRKPHRFVGIGAFNLVRRAALEKIGFFEKISMRPDDDVKLGKLLKKNKFKSECLIASDQVSVEWYSSYKDCERGLEKNLFAGTDYNLIFAFAAILSGVLTTILPYYLLFVTQGWLFYFLLTLHLLEVVTIVQSSKVMNKSLTRALFYPVSSLLFSYLALRTTLKNLWQGGIYWRDTFYPLAELKKNKV